MRLHKVILILGKKGSGKTYYTVNNLIAHYRRTHPYKKVLIYNMGGSPDYDFAQVIRLEDLGRWKPDAGGVYQVTDTDYIAVLEAINKYVYNGIVIFEDASKYITKTLQKSAWRSILDSKQHGLDMVFQFHGFAACPPELLRQCDVITMFRCDNPQKRKDDMVAYDEVAEAWARVMNDKVPFPYETVIVA